MRLTIVRGGKNMKKLSVIILGLLLASGAAFAETTQFTPLNFSDSTSVNSASKAAAITTDTDGNVLLDPSQVTGGVKMQNAILQIDNAQVEMRNKLLEYRTDYAKIDNQYETTKADRKLAKKKIKQAEKKIKNLEKVKKNIRKNFEQKNNI